MKRGGSGGDAGDESDGFGDEGGSGGGDGGVGREEGRGENWRGERVRMNNDRNGRGITEMVKSKQAGGTEERRTQ